MLNKNIIPLHFEDNAVVLVGKNNGKKVYKKQIKNLFKYDAINVLVFPEYVKYASISFIEGMFYIIRKNIEIEKVEEYIKIESSSESLINKIYSIIKFI